MFERFYAGRTIELDLDALGERSDPEDDLRAAETAVVALLSDA